MKTGMDGDQGVIGSRQQAGAGPERSRSRASMREDSIEIKVMYLLGCGSAPPLAAAAACSTCGLARRSATSFTYALTSKIGMLSGVQWGKKRTSCIQNAKSLSTRAQNAASSATICPTAASRAKTSTAYKRGSMTGLALFLMRLASSMPATPRSMVESLGYHQGSAQNTLHHDWAKQHRQAAAALRTPVGNVGRPR